MTYTPNYIPGKIVVKFRDDYSNDFEKQFGKALGFTCDGQVFGGVSLYNVPIGQEEQAMKKLSEHYKEFIEWTELYDDKLSSRFESVEALETMARDLNDIVDSDDKFRTSLDKIIAYSKNLKNK